MKDEANGGNRDPRLEDTYKNLPNLRYVASHYKCVYCEQSP